VAQERVRDPRLCVLTSKADEAMSEASRHTSFLRPAPATAMVVLLSVAFGGCGDGAPNQVVNTIDRDTFIEVYVDLRSVALRKTTRRINDVERDSVLAMHGVDEEDLRLFLEVHHADAEFMRDLWNEAEGRVSVMLEMTGRGTDGDD